MPDPNTSATGGTLFPALPLPLDDDALDAVLQQLVVDVTQLPGTMVRPRWQQAEALGPNEIGGVPKQPEPGVNWCALGVTEVEQDDGPWLVYDEVNNVEHYWDHETFSVLVSFYGPNAQSFARLLRAGLNVPQNTEELLPYAIRYLSCGPIRTMNELKNQQWIHRQDITLHFRRKVVMTFEVQNILISEIILQDDTGQVKDTILVPPGAAIVGVGGFMFGESDFGEGEF